MKNYKMHIVSLIMIGSVSYCMVYSELKPDISGFATMYFIIAVWYLNGILVDKEL